MIRDCLVYAQAATFIGLAIVLAAQADWRLAAAQALLAGVTALVYL